MDVAAGIDNVEDWVGKPVFQRFEDSPAGPILKLAEILAPHAPGMVVGEDAVLNCAVRPTAPEWARFVAECDRLRGANARSA